MPALRQRPVLTREDISPSGRDACVPRAVRWCRHVKQSAHRAGVIPDAVFGLEFAAFPRGGTGRGFSLRRNRGTMPVIGAEPERSPPTSKPPPYEALGPARPQDRQAAPSPLPCPDGNLLRQGRRTSRKACRHLRGKGLFPFTDAEDFLASTTSSATVDFSLGHRHAGTIPNPGPMPNRKGAGCRPPRVAPRAGKCTHFLAPSYNPGMEPTVEKIREDPNLVNRHSAFSLWQELQVEFALVVDWGTGGKLSRDDPRGSGTRRPGHGDRGGQVEMIFRRKRFFGDCEALFS